MGNHAHGFGKGSQARRAKIEKEKMEALNKRRIRIEERRKEEALKRGWTLEQFETVEDVKGKLDDLCTTCEEQKGAKK